MSDAFREIRDPETGRLILRYDEDGERVEVKSRQTGNRVRVYDLKDSGRQVDKGTGKRVKR